MDWPIELEAPTYPWEKIAKGNKYFATSKHNPFVNQVENDNGILLSEDWSIWTSVYFYSDNISGHIVDFYLYFT